MSNDYQLRKMIISDLERVLEIEEGIFSSPWTEEMFIHEIEMHDSFICVSKDEIEGYICGWNIIDEYHITNVGVDKKFQSKGVASFMLGQLLSMRIETGMRYFFLEVRESNQKAISLYLKFGFEVIGKRKKYYTEPQEDALIMGFFPYGKPDFI